MGTEVKTTVYSEEDERKFLKNLRHETKILKSWFDSEGFDDCQNPKCGLEVEAWLTKPDFTAAAECENFLNQINHPLVVPEIAKFNFEMNIEPEYLGRTTFTDLFKKLEVLWNDCSATAEKMDLRAISIGSLPSITQEELSMTNMYPHKRYFALNDRVLKLRQNLPVICEIEGEDFLRAVHYDVMLEAAATSMQIHLQVSQEMGKRMFNASTVASMFSIALSANSPYLYNKCLWSETRVPVFEQSINLGSFRNTDGSIASRVSLGNGYVRHSLFELFLENLHSYPVILPEDLGEGNKTLNHLRLHNGTVWRWNRPLIGFDKKEKPHIRIEHRAPSSGPTMIDIIANMAFYIGVTHYLAELETPPEDKLYFYQTRNNFYESCKNGLEAQVKWIDGKTWKIGNLIEQELLTPAKEALSKLGVCPQDIDYYIGKIISGRLKTGQTGSQWQRLFVAKHGLNFEKLLDNYYKNQKAMLPVHEWKV